MSNVKIGNVASFLNFFKSVDDNNVLDAQDFKTVKNSWGKNEGFNIRDLVVGIPLSGSSETDFFDVYAVNKESALDNTETYRVLETSGALFGIFNLDVDKKANSLIDEISKNTLIDYTKMAEEKYGVGSSRYTLALQYILSGLLRNDYRSGLLKNDDKKTRDEKAKKLAEKLKNKSPEDFIKVLSSQEKTPSYNIISSDIQAYYKATFPKGVQ